jgi:hypothetical protein
MSTRLGVSSSSDAPSSPRCPAHKAAPTNAGARRMSVPECTGTSPQIRVCNAGGSAMWEIGWPRLAAMQRLLPTKPSHTRGIPSTPSPGSAPATTCSHCSRLAATADHGSGGAGFHHLLELPAHHLPRRVSRQGRQHANLIGHLVPRQFRTAPRNQSLLVEGHLVRPGRAAAG